jgi:hypothetical protein
VYVINLTYSLFTCSLRSAVLTVNQRSPESTLCMLSTTSGFQVVFVRPLLAPLSHIFSALLKEFK